MITIDFKRLCLKPGDRVLDIGCGEGRHTAKAWEFPGIFCVGADMCHRDLLVSQKKLKLHEELSVQSKSTAIKQDISIAAKSSSQNSNLLDIEKTDIQYRSKWELAAADITRLPFDNHSFDKVICSEVMEHIHNEDQAFIELKRIIKPGGYLALSVPRYWPEKICWKLSHDYCHTQGGHIRIYTKKELLQKVTSLGFKFKGSHYAHSLHSPFWWIKCFTGLNRSHSDSKIVSLYHRLLVWDLMKKPFITGFTERLLNPLMGKSLVLYFIKPNGENICK